MELQTLEQKAKSIVMENLINFIEKNPEKDWDWDNISENKFKKNYEFKLNKLQERIINPLLHNYFQ